MTINIPKDVGSSGASGQFKFVQVSDPHTLRIVFSGFWDEAVMQAYQQALRQRALVAGGSTPTSRVLLDLLDCSIQSLAVLESMKKVIDNYAGQIKEYGMLLPHSALLRIQMKRLMVPYAVTYFESEAEATAWLAPR